MECNENSGLRVTPYSSVGRMCRSGVVLTTDLLSQWNGALVPGRWLEIYQIENGWGPFHVGEQLVWVQGDTNMSHLGSLRECKSYRLLKTSCTRGKCTKRLLKKAAFVR